MRLRIHDLALSVEKGEEELPRLVEKALGLPPGAAEAFTLVRKSLDARKKDALRFVYTVDVESPVKPKGSGRGGASKIEVLSPVPKAVESAAPFKTGEGKTQGRKSAERPVVVGSGPAGLFAALALARTGLRPLVLERGKPVEERVRDVELLLREGLLDPDSNIQFGEGGAGTFSDGKLATNIRDPLCRSVLEEFVAAGAPEEILYLAKPHIGTDLLRLVVMGLRRKIEAAGGEFRFRTLFTDFADEGKRLRLSVRSGGREEILGASGLILAPGNSGREVFELLAARGVDLEAKPFSVGVRIEHPQELIDRIQYGRFAGNPRLGAADYKLVHHCGNGRSVYTFCMCPGGWVVPGASEPGGLATNGMSEHDRNGRNANSALLVGIGPEDFGGGGPLAGMAFQRRWERAAYEAGGGGFRAPVQRLEDFLLGRPSRGPGEVLPSYRPGVAYGDLSVCLPGFAASALREALPMLGRKLPGFDFPDAVLTAAETRSSSPLRIKRTAEGEASVKRFFPAGEGAGYAGGIMSAAVDGIKAAGAFLALYG